MEGRKGTWRRATRYITTPATTSKGFQTLWWGRWAHIASMCVGWPLKRHTNCGAIVKGRLILDFQWNLRADCRAVGYWQKNLVHTIAGHRTSGIGDINRPSPSEIIFLPQNTYSTLQTLLKTLVYLRSLSWRGNVWDETLLGALVQINRA